MSDLSLASEFPAATRDAWRGLVERVLKGADFDRKLVSETYDGLRIEPLYPKAEGAPTVPARAPLPWRVAQRVDHPEAAAANALALADLEGGADALVITFAGAPAARGLGLSVASVAELDAALSGIMLDLVAVRIEAGARGREAARLMLDLAERRGHALDALELDLGLDPIGAMAADGRLSAPWPAVSERLSAIVREFRERGFTGPSALADGRPYHEAGASEAQELAAVLSTALTYLRGLEAGGHEIEAARRAVSFLLAADADEFLTVAKLRALRRLWARIGEACGLSPEPLRLHAESAWRNTTRRDPWVNLLRGTMAGFSAGIGGADAIGILPFTAALGLPDAFARRLARNTQLILLEESNLWRVADPVAGSGGFEALTDALCEQAWAEFQALEREGGIVASLTSGALQGRIGAVRARRDTALATRREPITGTSEFPDIREADVAVLRPAPAREPRPQEVAPGAVGIEALASQRAAEPFESLRDRSDTMMAQTGSRPRVFLANLGPIAAFSARATFAKNAFEAGGVEALGNDGFASPDALAEAFRASAAPLACLCSSDELYGEEGAAIASALKRAGARRVYLAGRPGEAEISLREAGVDGFLALGTDLPAFLAEALDAAGSTGREV